MARPERNYVSPTAFQVAWPETPEPTVTEQEPVAVVASAVSYPGKAPRVYTPARQWQKEAYRHYGICGEARFAANWIANALSKVLIYAVDNIEDKNRLDNGPAVNALKDLFAGADGRSQMMHALGLHLTLAGECYIIGRTVQGEDEWTVRAITEVSVNGENWVVAHPEDATQADIQLGESDTVIRVWRPSPEKHRDPDSPFRSLIPVLAEIEWATLHIFAQLSSRLTGAGLMFVSDGVQIAEAPRTNTNQEQQQVQNKATVIMQLLAAAMMRPVRDPSAPESLVPTVMTVPEELLKSGKVAELMHFWTDLDEKAQGIRSDAVARFADGFDIPAEKLRGLSTAPTTGGGRSTGPNHWGMWQIDEEAITVHIEPLAELICNIITVGYLQQQDDVTDPDNAAWYDTAALRLRPDRSKESIELYQMGLIKAEVVVLENRFTKTDMMDDSERKTWLLIQVATGKTSGTPEQIAAALEQLGVTGIPAGTPTPEVRGPMPQPSIEDHPVKALPEAAATRHNVLLHSCEPLVLRALERAGNRLKQSVRQIGGTPPDVPAYAMHTLVAANGSTEKVLTDAFTGMADICLSGVEDPATVIPVLESYVSTLVMEQAPHDRARLDQWLKQAELA